MANNADDDSYERSRWRPARTARSRSRAATSTSCCRWARSMPTCASTTTTTSKGAPGWSRASTGPSPKATTPRGTLTAVAQCIDSPEASTAPYAERHASALRYAAAAQGAREQAPLIGLKAPAGTLAGAQPPAHEHTDALRYALDVRVCGFARDDSPELVARRRGRARERVAIAPASVTCAGTRRPEGDPAPGTACLQREELPGRRHLPALQSSPQRHGLAVAQTPAVDADRRRAAHPQLDLGRRRASGRCRGVLEADRPRRPARRSEARSAGCCRRPPLTPVAKPRRVRQDAPTPRSLPRCAPRRRRRRSGRAHVPAARTQGADGAPAARRRGRRHPRSAAWRAGTGAGPPPSPVGPGGERSLVAEDVDRVRSELVGALGENVVIEGSGEVLAAFDGQRAPRILPRPPGLDRDVVQPRAEVRRG